MMRRQAGKGATGPDPKAIKREKERAREMRKSTWWQNLVNNGVCHYCNGAFEADLITMDHVVPLSRGGKSTKGNIVPACKDCNTKKKHATPVDMILSGTIKPDLKL